MKKSKKINIKYCPRCKTASLDFYAGSITGIYHCKKCGYMGPIVIEKFSKRKI